MKSARVALIDGGRLILSARGGRDSVGAGDTVVGAEDADGTGKDGEDENDGGEGVNEHLDSSS